MESERVVVSRPARWRVGLGAAVVLVLVAFGLAVMVSLVGAAGATESVSVEGASSQSTGTAGTAPGAASGGPAAPDADVGRIFVHILGAVHRPGLYELRSGSRAIDVVAAAGGYTEAADEGVLNLARLLIDGEQITVPVEGAGPPVAPPGASSGAGGSAAGGAVGGLVNLNTADATALDTLPGVGPTTAEKILRWREENGGFTSVEDLLSVAGIGEKTFAELEGLVTV